jgi:hypothetical protein
VSLARTSVLPNWAERASLFLDVQSARHPASVHDFSFDTQQSNGDDRLGVRLNQSMLVASILETGMAKDATEEKQLGLESQLRLAVLLIRHAVLHWFKTAQ